MSAREHLAQVLEGTGLYELTGSSPVDWELAAYGVGFALLEERFDQLLGDLFPATASREKLAQWEELFRPQRARASLEDCRETVWRRLAIQRDGFTPPDVQALLPGAGVRGLLLEGESGLTVVLGRLLGVTQAEAQRERRGLLIEDGWTYFIHGWTQVIAEVFHIDITGERLAACDRLAREMRK